MKIQNNFIKGIVNKDLDERLVPEGFLVDAENVLVSVQEGSGMGVVKNIIGNKMIYDPSTLLSPKTIGLFIDESKDIAYHFITSQDRDVIMKYSLETGEVISAVKMIESLKSGSNLLNFSANNKINTHNIGILLSDTDEGDLLAFTDGVNPPRLLNTNKVYEDGLYVESEISVMKPAPIFAPTITFTNVALDGEDNFIKEKFLTFAYRYKYEDGFYSAMSPWSEVAFVPGKFSVDYDTYENKGMLNDFNAVVIGVQTGGEEVIQVDLLFRESNDPTVYVVDKFVKLEQSWADNVAETFVFSKAKIRAVLPLSQYYRNFDNVPLTAQAQTVIGNRLLYGNFVEGMNIDTNVNFEVGFVSEEIALIELESTIQDEIGGLGLTDVDFTSKDLISGADNGEINLDNNTISPTIDGSVIDIDINPSSNSIPYTVEVYNNNVLIHSDTGVLGDYFYQINPANIGDVIKFKYFSEDSIGFRMNGDASILQSSLFKQEAYIKDQYVFPYNIKPNYINVTDFNDFDFVEGKIITLNFDLESSLDIKTKPNFSFNYVIDADYISVDDFLTNSNFNNQISTVLMPLFVNEFASGAGDLLSQTDFLAYESEVNGIPDLGGGYIAISNPILNYNVSETVGGNLIEKVDYYMSNDFSITISKQGSKESMHSNRDYEVCMIYRDKYGRKTTAITSKDNTVYIPCSNSDTSNKLTVMVNHLAPTEAKYYGFGIKEVSKAYDIIYGNLVYKDDAFIWIRLSGESLNKVKEGDNLIVKSDFSKALDTLVKVKILETKTQEKNFILGNKNEDGKDVIEKSGFYIRIKQSDFDANIEEGAKKEFKAFVKRRYATRSKVRTTPYFGDIDESEVFIADKLTAGSPIRLKIVVKAYGKIEFYNSFEVDSYVSEDRDSFQDWFENEVEIKQEWLDFITDNGNGNYSLKAYGFGADGRDFWVTPFRDGTASRDIITSVDVSYTQGQGNLVFETDPIVELETPFYETPTVYTINPDRTHQTDLHVLDRAFNCYTFGNGVESFKIKDGFVNKGFVIDANPTAASEDTYRKINRFADLTYSEPIQQSSNVNRLNEFNLSLANYKDDMDKSFGKITVVKGFDTNLEVLQENKHSVVYYGKDLLFNADGQTNLAAIPDVLGQQVALTGEYGCQNGESFDFFGNERYYSDVRRGAVISKTNGGLFPISNYYMEGYFRSLFRNNAIDETIGCYDQDLGVFVLNIKYNGDKYVTWLYSDRQKGWVAKFSFNPEVMARGNGYMYSTSGGRLFVHGKYGNGNQRNQFYFYPVEASITFNMNIEPSTRKVFRTLTLEGNTTWTAYCSTDMQSGSIEAGSFVNKENVYYAYIRGLSETHVSVTGLGNVKSIDTGLNSIFVHTPISNLISIGDKVTNELNEEVGIIKNIDYKTGRIELNDDPQNILVGDFAISKKSPSAETSGILGYYMSVNLRNSSSSYAELFSVGSEISKSFM